MSLQTGITALALAIAADIKALLAGQGVLSTLATADKTSLVGAINELHADTPTITVGTTAPLMNGTASAGVAAAVSREDHVHPAAMTSTSTATASVVVSPWQNVLSIVPGANTEGIFFGSMGQSVYSGTTSIINGGHTVGTMGWSVNYGSGTHEMMIGAEGRLDQGNIGQGAPTLTKGVGVLGLLNSSYGTITSAQGLASEISVGSGATLTEAIGTKVSVAANAGTITKYTGLFMPEHTGFVAGITAKRFFECLDTQAPAITKSPIVQQDYVVVSPVSGATVTIGNFTSYTVVAPGGALAALTIALPSAPIDGQEAMVLVTQKITAVTITAGVAILNAPTTLPAGATFIFKYIQGYAVWVLVQAPDTQKITVGTTAPANPYVGELWVDTN